MRHITLTMIALVFAWWFVASVVGAQVFGIDTRGWELTSWVGLATGIAGAWLIYRFRNSKHKAH